MKRHELEEAKQEFVVKRGLEGKSFDKISEETGVSKPTLIKWSQELDNEIQLLKREAFLALVDKFRLCEQRKLEEFSKLLNKCFDELGKRDFEYVEVEKLYKIAMDLMTYIDIQKSNSFNSYQSARSKKLYGF